MTIVVHVIQRDTGPLSSRLARFEQFQAYRRKIRNRVKSDYALAYWQWLVGQRDDEPDKPDTLSYMAAQAVRMTLDIIDGTPIS